MEEKNIKEAHADFGHLTVSARDSQVSVTVFKDRPTVSALVYISLKSIFHLFQTKEKPGDTDTECNYRQPQ